MKKPQVKISFPLCALTQPAQMAFSYNEYGDLASASDGSVESTFEYKYDENGNWTTRYQIVNGKCMEIIVRQLKYRSVEECIAESDVENEPEEEMKQEEVIEEEDEVEEEVEEEANQEAKEVMEDAVEELEEKEAEEGTEDVRDNTAQENEFSETPPDALNSLVGKSVRHTKYSTGRIVSVEQKGEKQYITIAFAFGKRQFVYPDAFESYLTWCEENN